MDLVTKANSLNRPYYITMGVLLAVNTVMWFLSLVMYNGLGKTGISLVVTGVSVAFGAIYRNKHRKKLYARGVDDRSILVSQQASNQALSLYALNHKHHAVLLTRFTVGFAVVSSLWIGFCFTHTTGIIHDMVMLAEMMFYIAVMVTICVYNFFQSSIQVTQA